MLSSKHYIHALSRRPMIPRVDLKDSHSIVQRRFTDALKDKGFCILQNSNIEHGLVQQAYNEMQHFFGRPVEYKQQFEHPEIGRQRGYASYGIEQALGADTPDPKEFYSIGNDRSRCYAPTKMPNFPFERTARELYFQNKKLSHRLLNMVSDDCTGHTHSFGWSWLYGEHLLRYIHYPDSDADILAAEHEDINLLTILPYSPQSGLQIKDNDGTWYDAPQMNPGEVIVDSGDMLKLWSNDRYKSTTHRVVRTEEGSRYSMPFFVHPEPNFVLAKGMKAKDYLEDRLRSIGVL